MPIKSTDYLRELADRLRKVPVCHGVDGHDIDSLREVSMGIAELEKANVAYVDANTLLIRENAKLREALEAIRDIEPEQFNAYPADWQEQIAGCEKCQGYKNHPIMRGICDTHRQPMNNRDSHDAHQVRALGYRAKSMAREALSPPLKEKADA